VFATSIIYGTLESYIQGRYYIKRIDKMCGRFVLLIDFLVITESFNVQNVACEYRPGNNIFPGQQIPSDEMTMSEAIMLRNN
jgi:hypothetical protein